MRQGGVGDVLAPGDEVDAHVQRGVGQVERHGDTVRAGFDPAEGPGVPLCARPGHLGGLVRFGRPERREGQPGGADPDRVAAADPVAEEVVHGERFGHGDGDRLVPLRRDQRHRRAELLRRTAQHRQRGLAHPRRVTTRQRHRAGACPVAAVGGPDDEVVLGERDQDAVGDGAVDAEVLGHVLHGQPARLRGDQFEGEQPPRERLRTGGLARLPRGALRPAAPRVRPRLVVAHPASLRARRLHTVTAERVSGPVKWGRRTERHRPSADGSACHRAPEPWKERP